MMIKYNIGCGKRNFGPDWFNVDGADLPHIGSNDIHLSETPDSIVDIIYSSHLIAYLSRNGAKALFQSWHRVLKPGGRLEIATPDFNKLSYLHNNGRATLDEITGPLFGRMLLNGQEIYHKMAYSFVTLALILEAVGFTGVRLYDHRKTCHPNTGNREDKFDDHSAAYLHGELISLNVEARKL